jgi:hypothetical protein
MLRQLGLKLENDEAPDVPGPAVWYNSLEAMEIPLGCLDMQI